MSRTTTETSLAAVRKHANDSGSVEVQIIALAATIYRLTDHFKKFPKDFSSKRGMLKAVSRQRCFLRYLKTHDMDSFQKVTAQLRSRK